MKEIPENGSDINHLDHVHGSPIVSGADLRYSFTSWWQFAKHKWFAEWRPLEGDEKHVGCLKLKHVLSIFGYIIPFTDFHVTARQVCILLVIHVQLNHAIFNPQGKQKIVHGTVADSKMTKKANPRENGSLVFKIRDQSLFRGWGGLVEIRGGSVIFMKGNGWGQISLSMHIREN